MKINKRSIAYHEAGHAVIAFRLGIIPRIVTIRALGDSEGRVERRAIRPSLNPDRTARAALIGVMISCAGPAAEVQYTPRYDVDGWDSDLTAAEKYLPWFNGKSPDQNLELTKWLTAHTKGVVQENWGAIDFIARMLLQAKRLNRRQMIQLMNYYDRKKGTPPSRPDNFLPVTGLLMRIGTK